MERTKENAWDFFAKMICNSWSYQKMTESEKEKCFEALRWGKIFGSFDQRIEQLHGKYYAFLLGIGYTGAGWREENLEEIPLF